MAWNSFLSLSLSLSQRLALLRAFFWFIGHYTIFTVHCPCMLMNRWCMFLSFSAVIFVIYITPTHGLTSISLRIGKVSSA